MPNGSGLASVQHVVVLMLENRSFDHMLGFLYPGNVSPSGQPFKGLTGTESNPGSNGQPRLLERARPRPLERARPRPLERARPRLLERARLDAAAPGLLAFVQP